MQINNGAGGFAALPVADYQTSALTSEADVFAATVITGVTLGNGTNIGNYQLWGSLGANEWRSMFYAGLFTAGNTTDFGAGAWGIIQGDYGQGVWFIPGLTFANHEALGHAQMITTDGTLYRADICYNADTGALGFCGDIPVINDSPGWWGGDVFPGTDNQNTPVTIRFQFIAPVGID